MAQSVAMHLNEVHSSKLHPGRNELDAKRSRLFNTIGIDLPDLRCTLEKRKPKAWVDFMQPPSNPYKLSDRAGSFHPVHPTHPSLRSNRRPILAAKSARMDRIENRHRDISRRSSRVLELELYALSFRVLGIRALLGSSWVGLDGVPPEPGHLPFYEPCCIENRLIRFRS